MNLRTLLRFIPAAVLTLVLAVEASSAASQGQKIPVTTGSKKALSLFLEGRTLQDKLRAQDSLRFFEQAVKEDPEFAMGYLFLAFAQSSAKGFFENIEKAHSLLEKVSEGERLWIMGAHAGANGLPAQQKGYFRKLVEAYPSDERAHNLLGNYYFGRQEWTLAIGEFEKAIAIAPDFSQPYNQLGYAHRFMENYAEAEKAFRKYIALIPDDPNPHDSYAELLMKMGKYDASIEHYQKALSLDPNFVASHIGIATNLIFKGEHANARRQLEKFYAIARNDGERRAAHFTRAISYVDEGNLEKALEEFEKQYALAEKITDAAAMSGDLVLMGTLLIEAGKYDGALEKFEKSVEVVEASDLSDDFKEITRDGHLYNAGYVHLKKGDLADAKAKAEECRKKADAADRIFQRRLACELAGMIALEEKEYDRALQELTQANQQDPYTLYRMALAARGKGDRESARNLCMKAADFNALNSLSYAFVRSKAREMAKTL